MPAKPPPPNPPPPRDQYEGKPIGVVGITIGAAALLGVMLAMAYGASGERRAIAERSESEARAEAARHEANEREKNAAIAECERNGYTAVLGYGWKVVCVRAACVPNEGSPCL
jgi:hypothetical protein